MIALTLEEFTRDYGLATERRQVLYERFQGWLAVVQPTQMLRRVWIFGSFASQKPNPGDLDILALMAAGFDPTEYVPEIRNWFDHELCRAVHEIDLFFVTESAVAETLEFILETFGRDRSGKESIMEILL